MIKTGSFSSNFSPWILLAIALLFYLWLMQPYGLGATPDSVNYIKLAKNLAIGKGFVDDSGSFVKHWPPLYPIFLSLGYSLCNEDIFKAGLILNILLFATSFLAFWKCLKALNFASISTLILLSLFIVSKPMSIYRFFWSEALFLPLLLWVVYFFLKWSKSQKLKYILLASVFSAAFLMTRYAGIGFIAGFSFLLFFSKGWKRKVKNLSLYLLPILASITAWLFYSYTPNQSQVNRELSFHLIEWSKIQSLFETIESWFIYKQISLLSNIPNILLVIAAFTILLFQNKYFKEGTELINEYRKEVFLLLTLGLSYLLFLFVSISFLDANTPLDNRILSPLYPILLLLIGIIFRKISFRKNLLAIPMLLLISVSIAYAYIPYWKYHYKYGSAYTSKKFKDSASLSFIRDLKTTMTIYSNSPELIQLYTNLQAEILPNKYSPTSKEPNEEYLNEIALLREKLKNSEAIIVYFDKAGNRSHLIQKEEIQDLFSDYEIRQLKDGFVILKL